MEKVTHISENNNMITPVCESLCQLVLKQYELTEYCVSIGFVARTRMRTFAQCIARRYKTCADIVIYSYYRSYIKILLIL